MASETAALKQSFFKEYFRHKLSTLKGFNITLAIMNFFVTTVSALVLLISCIALRNEALGYDSSYYRDYVLTSWMMGILFLTFIAENIVIMVMAAVNMRSCHSRSAMDTIGGLPLTVKQRFFGDFLSGLASFASTFLIGCIPAFIMMAVIQFKISPEFHAAKIANGSTVTYLISDYQDKFVLLGFLVGITMFICLAASYSVACFVTSCCGRLNTSIIFTFVVTAAIPLIFGTYGAYIFNNSTGVTGGDYIRAVNMFPPVGTVYHVFYSFVHGLFEDFEFAVRTPKVIVMLAFVILPALGAYLVSMKRKAEGVDKPFIHKSAYTVITFLISVTACGLILANISIPAFVFPVFVFTAAACIFIEYIRSHSKRTFWKGLVRLVISAAVCVGFALIVHATNGFDIGKKLPDENKIEAVSFTGDYFYDKGYRSEAQDDKNVISRVLSEHKKIIDNSDEFRAGGDTWSWGEQYKSLTIIYAMKDGSSIRRRYISKSEEGIKLIEDFGKALLEMPEVYNRTTLGTIGNPDLSCVKIEYCYYDEDYMKQYFIIKESARDEFISCLREDLLNRSKQFEDNSTRTRKYIDYFYINASGSIESITVDLRESDVKTNAFLSDPNNFGTQISVTIDENASYYVSYYADGFDAEADAYATLSAYFYPDSAAKRELASYFETEYTTDGDYSDKFHIECGGKYLKIKTENEHAALTAFINIIKEQQAEKLSQISGGIGS